MNKPRSVRPIGVWLLLLALSLSSSVADAQPSRTRPGPPPKAKVPDESAAEPAPEPLAAEPAATLAQDSAPTIREGPYRVTCYKDEAVVFEHGTIYRVYRPDGADSGWSYETGDGLKYRGRIGENVNCVWQ